MGEGGGAGAEERRRGGQRSDAWAGEGLARQPPGVGPGSRWAGECGASCTSARDIRRGSPRHGAGEETEAGPGKGGSVGGARVDQTPAVLGLPLGRPQSPREAPAEPAERSRTCRAEAAPTPTRSRDGCSSRPARFQRSAEKPRVGGPKTWGQDWRWSDWQTSPPPSQPLAWSKADDTDLPELLGQRPEKKDSALALLPRGGRTWGLSGSRGRNSCR